MITVGFASTRTGRKAHRHANGYAFCGAGRLIEAPREIADGDQLCKHCAKHMTSRIDNEIERLDRRASSTRYNVPRAQLRARIVVLSRFIESARRMDDVHAEAIELNELRTQLVCVFDAYEAEIDRQFECHPVRY
jgi:hypothetical protein